MNQPGNPDLLTDMARRLAARLTDDRTSLAWVFARYQAAEDLDDLALARQLAVAPELLARIAICGLPRPDHFREDVTAIAERFGVDRGQLARIVRQTQALETLYQAPTSSSGFLLAARDRVAEDHIGYEPGQVETGEAAESGQPTKERDEGEPR
jgi:hypothetical protein